MRARILLEVVAGVIPGTPMPEYTKQWAVSSDVWYAQGEYEDRDEEAKKELLQVYDSAQEYMRSLWWPANCNWVRCEWIYL